MVSLKREIIASFDTAPSSLRAFLCLRTLLLPLERIDRELPERGRLIEIGSGHGIVSQYLARRWPERRVVGIEPDERRLAIARHSARGLANLEFRGGYFGPGMFSNLDGVVIVGVLYLIEDAAAAAVLSAARASLRPGGRLLLCDAFAEGGLSHQFLIFRERFLRRIGFTQGKVLRYRSAARWREMLDTAGLARTKVFTARSLSRSTFFWICEPRD